MEMNKITPYLWFDTDAEEAATFYTSVFGGRILDVASYGSAGPREEGLVMLVTFELFGQTYVALNGGPHFTFNPAVSFQVLCESQEEVDELWERLSGDGGEADQCGWVRDRFGLSWQITPRVLEELVRDPDPGRSQRAIEAMMGMKKIDIAELQRAAEGP
jgi:predicted 3-demethylubiquinone-9 3-methyltransferase (glyoxalase superfamily)